MLGAQFSALIQMVGGGQHVVAHGSQPLVLDDPCALYLIEQGTVDLFVVPLNLDNTPGARRHFLRLHPGQMFCGFSPASLIDLQFSLLATASQDQHLVQLERSALAQYCQNQQNAEQFAPYVDDWIDQLTLALRQPLPPKLFDQEVQAGQQLDVENDLYLRSKKGVLWIHQQQGAGLFCGDTALPANVEDSFFPLSHHAWLQTTEPLSLNTIDTINWLQQDGSWLQLDTFHAFCLTALRRDLVAEQLDQQQRFAHKKVIDQRKFGQSLECLADILNTDDDIRINVELDPLLAVCRLVAKPLGIEIVPVPDRAVRKPNEDPLEPILRAARIRSRSVALKGAWWQSDNGPMIAYLEEDKRPVALLQRSACHYELVDPANGSRTKITADVAATLNPFAKVLYRSLPACPIKGWDLIKFAAHGRSSDLIMVLIMGVAGGLLGLVMPLATGILFDEIIPGAQLNQLLILTLALIVGAIAAAVFEFTRSIAILRIEGRADQHVQGAIWDRLLELPVPFFKDYSAGDLAQRVMGIYAMRQVLSGAIVSTIISQIFSCFSLALLFYYSFKMGMVALGISLVSVVVMVWGGYYQLKLHNELLTIQGQISGMVLEFITGIAKFRAAAAESRVFSRWSRSFAQQQQVAYKVSSTNNLMAVYFSVFPLLSTMVIFACLLLYIDKGSMTTGQFLAFNAAFGQFSMAMITLSACLLSGMSVIPLYRRCQPILDAVPEFDPEKVDPGELLGAIEVNHLSFRYSDETPLVLDNLSLQIRPGEFVAVIGSSGSGKSTLLRLLLGFETATSGGVYYDGQDLSAIDIRSVRRQMGTVLQNGQVMSGDIFTNIIGSSNLTLDDAWAAARMAGLDKDIEQMPMGMHTFIPQGGGTFSGGQRQRLLIARALVNKPRILFFDEATSALDNKTQAIVNDSIERLHTTRVVIAHRLSTIINADRIYVLDGGRIAQCGTYAELIGQPGLFAELAKRQIA
jgi:NHLM bacteriocin system ABC transporter ATP-binding protein